MVVQIVPNNFHGIVHKKASDINECGFIISITKQKQIYVLIQVQGKLVWWPWDDYFSSFKDQPKLNQNDTYFGNLSNALQHQLDRNNKLYQLSNDELFKINDFFLNIVNE